jgi:hypothetical protein
LGYTTAEDDFKRAYERQGEFQKPFIDDGGLARDQIMQLMGLRGDTNAANYGEYAKAFGAGEFALDPGYAFRQSEGIKGLGRSASARGGVLSGGALKDITRFGQELASQEFQNAFNRAQTERAARLNTLGGISSSGQSASNVMTGAAGQYGSNSAANALARSQATSANSIGRGAATGSLAVNRGLTTGNIARERGAVTSSNLLNLGEATAGIGLARGNTASTNALNLGASTKANDARYYGAVGGLELDRATNTANNAFYVSDAAQRGAQNIGNAASASAYNTGNALANNAISTGNARASGYAGTANAFNNAIGQITGYAMQAPLNNAVLAYYRNRTV